MDAGGGEAVATGRGGDFDDVAVVVVAGFFFFDAPFFEDVVVVAVVDEEVTMDTFFFVVAPLPPSFEKYATMMITMAETPRRRGLISSVSPGKEFVDMVVGQTR